jgi:NADH dehydrogenase
MTAMGVPRPRVVVIGGGFGGVAAVRALRHADVDITVLDRTNHHLFQPLLYQVATATLAPTDITVPIRWIFRKQRNTRVLMAQVDRVDVTRRVVVMDAGTREESYDFLVVAAGARHSYFGHPEWEPDAPGLKSIDDAIELRQRILIAFEQAEKANGAAERRSWLTFVIVGAGPTGAELAGMIPTIATRALRPDFHDFDAGKVRVLLLEGGSKVLSSFPEPLADRARRDLVELGVEVRTDSIVTRVEPGVVHVGDASIRAHTVIWAAGNAASPLGASLGAPLDRVGRVIVEPDLSVPGHPEIFVIGDMAKVEHEGHEVPGVAPAAGQMGRTAARNIRLTLEQKPRVPFRYFNKGNLATIGRSRAIADFGFASFTGHLAWLLWLFVHILYLAGFRNRLSVLLQWGFSFFTYQRGARLITNAALRTTPPAAQLGEGPAPVVRASAATEAAPAVTSAT